MFYKTKKTFLHGKTQYCKDILYYPIKWVYVCKCY